MHDPYINKKAAMDRTERTGINEIASILSAKNEKITQEEATLFLKSWIHVITDALADKKQVEVNGFGTFDFSQVRERETAAQIEAGNEEVAYYYKIGFTPHETLRNSVNIFFSNFEPSLLNEGVTFDTLPEVVAGEKDAEEYIYNHIQKMIPLHKPQVGEIAIPAAEEIQVVETQEAEKILATEDTPETEIPAIADTPATKDTQVVEIPVIDTPAAERSETVFPPTDIPSTETRSNVLSESLHHISPQPTLTDTSTFRQRVRKRGRKHPVWVPILGGMAIIVAALFFFRETHGKNGNHI